MRLPPSASASANTYGTRTSRVTVAWQSDSELVAMRDIKQGEEIAYDYALTECHPEFRLNCRCGTAQVGSPRLLR